jgi:hypothetical protein
MQLRREIDRQKKQQPQQPTHKEERKETLVRLLAQIRNKQ